MLARGAGGGGIKPFSFFLVALVSSPCPCSMDDKPCQYVLTNSDTISLKRLMMRANWTRERPSGILVERKHLMRSAFKK